MLQDIPQLLFVNLLLGLAVFMFVRYGWARMRFWVHQEEDRLDRVLNHQLLLGASPRVALVLSLSLTLTGLVLPWMLFGNVVAGLVGALVAMFLPGVILRHLETKRRQKLELQLVDGIMTLASGVRAGLTLVQAMELLVKNSLPPIKQEFAQLLREYQMGMDLNQAMRNTANRVGLANYRLLFTAIEMHRLRGGDTGESLDRIAESIREIQRLEGKLDAITAQGRMQAFFMALMPIVILVIFYFIDPQGVTMLFTTPFGRVLLLASALLILVGFLWIRRIMAVDI